MFSHLRPPTVRVAARIASAQVHRGVLISKLYYLLYYGAIGTITPFLNVYLEDNGWSGSQIGWISSIPPLIALFANPFWSALADRWRIHRMVLALLTFVAGLISLLFLTSVQFWPILSLIIAMTFFRNPVAPIVDSTAVSLVRQGESTYGRQRLWGSIGFAGVSYGMGYLLASYDMTVAFWSHAIMMGVGCTLLGLLMPVEMPHQRVNLLAGVRALMGQRSYRGFLSSVILLGFAMASYITFLSLHMINLGGTPTQLGVMWVVMAGIEVPILYFGARSIEKYGYRRILQLCFIGFSVGWIVMAFVTSPLYLIGNVLLIGVFFSGYIVSVVNYADQTAPPGLSATAQAIVGAAQGGLGGSLGAIFAGYIWDVAGASTLFLVAAGVVALAALSFWWGNRESQPATTIVSGPVVSA